MHLETIKVAALLRLDNSRLVVQTELCSVLFLLPLQEEELPHYEKKAAQTTTNYVIQDLVTTKHFGTQ
jgi:hypothetical protein